MVSRFGVGGQVLACILALALYARCDASERIFLIEDDAATIHLSDQAQGRSPQIVAGRALAPAVNEAARHKAPNIGAIAEIVRQAAQANTLDPNLLHAVIAAESGYEARAVSPRGAQGLMQLMPATARHYGVTDVFDAQQNVRAGARHLRDLLDQFGQDTALALAAYNAGAAAVARHGRNVPPYAETVAYVPRVLQHMAARKRVTP